MQLPASQCRLSIHVTPKMRMSDFQSRRVHPEHPTFHPHVRASTASYVRTASYCLTYDFVPCDAPHSAHPGASYEMYDQSLHRFRRRVPTLLSFCLFVEVVGLGPDCWKKSLCGLCGRLFFVRCGRRLYRMNRIESNRISSPTSQSVFCMQLHVATQHSSIDIVNCLFPTPNSN